MKHTISFLSLAVAFFSLTNAAAAATVTVSLTGAAYSLSDTDAFGTNLVASNANLTTNAAVNVSMSNAGLYSTNVNNSHVINSGISNGSEYLAVMDTGSATFTFAQPINHFALNWGSIDAFNVLEIEDVNNNVNFISGSALLSPNFSGTTDGVSSLFLSYSSIAGLKSIVMSNNPNTNSFEVSNLNVSNVPLPAALPMFGLALAAFAGYGSRKRNARTTI